MILFEKLIKNVIVPPKKSIEDVMKERQLFFDNFDLILDNSETIRKNKQLFYTISPVMHLSAMFFGLRFIPIGVLLLLWEKDKLKERCPGCGDTAYIFNAAGSPMSGRKLCSAYCRNCRKEFSSRDGSFGSIFGPVHEVLKTYPPVIVKKKLFCSTESFLKEERDQVGITASLKAMNEIKIRSKPEPLPEMIIDDSAADCNMERLIGILKENGK